MISYEENNNIVHIETPLIQASIQTAGYVSGVMAGTFRDQITGISDPGFGLHIMDFLLAPGWRDDEYSRELKFHGNLQKHFVEKPQICTQAKKLNYTIIHSTEFVAVKQWFVFTQAGKGYQPGSRWEQTLLFLPDTRYFFSCETITSANAVDNLSYRIDMPGHIKHYQGNSFQKIYLSYYGIIASKEFLVDFAPDDRFLYVRNPDKIPSRFIRAYQLGTKCNSAPWLAGMTLDPSIPCEAWCHQRGYVCFIQENHGKEVEKGETFGAAYIIGYFDSIEEMNEVYDRYKGVRYIDVKHENFILSNKIPQI